MPLPLPKLDQYTFDELVGQGQALLPRYAPGWTDHNAHDPGITLVELFAWLAEMESYRLDRVTEASTRAFLRLVGIEPKPAQVAETVLVMTRKGQGPTVRLPARTMVTTNDRTVTFQTTHAVKVSPAKLLVVLEGSAGALTNCTAENESSTKRFCPFGVDPQPGDALYLGFDRLLADSPMTVHLHVWAGEPGEDCQTKRALVLESKMARAIRRPGDIVGDCGAWVNRWRTFPGDFKPIMPAGRSRKARATHCAQAVLTSWRIHYAVRTVWEYHAGGDQWLPLSEVTDKTRGLTLSGAVSFKAPEAGAHSPDGVTISGHAAHYFIRCRIVTGRYDCPPEIRFVQINTVRARHAVDAKSPIEISKTSGRAGQTYPLPDRPIVPGSTKVEVRVDALIEQDWREHLTWDRLGPHDRGYVLDPVQGEVRFGNGRAGVVPKAEANLAITYLIGGGPTGNVPEDSLTNLVAGIPSEVSVSQPVAAFGGIAAESLFDAKARAVAWLSTPHRAVTLKDFEQLALATPGVPVARAKALADYDPRLPCVPAPGAVTVVVLSKCPQTHPVASTDLPRAVARYIERRRLLTTEVHVIGPEYTKVVVRATLHVAAGTAAREVVTSAIAALNQFFDPLHGGQDGEGWPMGRAVYRAEILALLNALPGVVYVDELVLETVVKLPTSECDCTQEQEKTVPAQCGNIDLCPHGLVVPGQHHITVSIERAVP